MTTFSKRTFTARSLVFSFYRMLRYLPWLIWAYLLRGVERGLAEKILLVISSVNGCRYCRWFHSHMAIRNDVPATEVAQLLQHMVPTGVSESEQQVLLLAIQYAEQQGEGLSQSLEVLNRHHHPRTVKGVLALCATINFGNLIGNSFDAFLHRLQGRPVQYGSLFVEAVVFLLSASFLLPLLLWVRTE